MNWRAKCGKEDVGDNVYIYDVKPADMKYTPILVSAVAAFSFSCGSAERSDGPERPNILLIMTDDVTFDHWSCYGGELPTPHIENLARAGMKFYQAYTTSAACTPSRYSIMTGQYAGRSLSEEFRQGNPTDEPYVIAWNTPITEDNITMHEVLKQAGYYTGFVGKFHIGELGYEFHRDNPLIPGIDPDLSPDTELADSLLAIHQQVVSERVMELTGADYAGAIQWANPQTLPLKAIRRHNLEYQVYGVKQFLDQVPGDRPFFLTVNSTALHGPNHFDDLLTDPIYTAGGRIAQCRHLMPERSTIFERLYDLGYEYGEHVPDHIRHYLSGRIYMDDQLGTIMKLLKAAGLDENTLIIYTADHNIEPGKSTVYNRGVNVPFIAWWPGIINPGSVSYDHVQFIDFLPTFAELAGADVPDNVRLDGKSFAGVLEGPSLADDRVLYFEEGYTRGITDGKYKYIAMRFPEDVLDSVRSGRKETISHMGIRQNYFASIALEYFPGYFDPDQLYDLQRDPYEQQNLARDPAYAGVLERMQTELEKVLVTFDHPFDLSDSGYGDQQYYKDAAENMSAVGTSWIPWWNRTLEYPPVE